MYISTTNIVDSRQTFLKFARPKMSAMTTDIVVNRASSINISLYNLKVPQCYSSFQDDYNSKIGKRL